MRNIFWELFVLHGGTFAKPHEALAKLVNLMYAAAKSKGLQPPVSKLTMGMIRVSGKPPKLKLKAAEGRHMLPITVIILEWFMPPPPTTHEQLRLDCAQALNNVYKEMEPIIWVSSESPKVVRNYAVKHLLLYVELNKETRARCRKGTFWRLYPKHHLFHHVIFDTWDNPREDWCYGDEASIGICAQMCTKLHASTLQTQLLERHRL